MKMNLVFFKKMIVVIILLVALFWGISTYANWDLSRIGNEQTVPLSGEIVTTDGMVEFYPEAMTIDYQGMRVVIRYDIDEELKELGFNYIAAPRFSIEKNPPLETEPDALPVRYRENIVRAADVRKKTDTKGDYFEALFYFTDLPHYDENATYRLYLNSPGSLLTEVSKEFDIKMGVNKIEFPGIGSYHLDLRLDDRDDAQKLIASQETRSSLGNIFRVHDKIIGIYDGTKFMPGGGTGSGSSHGGSNIYREQGEYEVDNAFISAQRYFVKVHSIILNLEHNMFDEPYLDLQ